MNTKNYQYKRPQYTYQDLISSEEITKKLTNYKQVDSINNIKIGTHIRYYDNKKSPPLFRLGGILNYIDKENRYIKLSNGDLSWSVQLGENSTLYYKLTEEEVTKEIKTHIIAKMGDSISKLNVKEEKYNNLKNKYEELYKQYSVLNSKVKNKK